MDEEDNPGDVISPPEKETPLTKPSKVSKETTKQTKNVKGKENKDKVAQKQNKVVLENVNKSKLAGMLLEVHACLGQQ